MSLQLFPMLAPALPPCFGLRGLGARALEIPPPIAVDTDPVHLVHSDVLQLAVLSALAAVQSWAVGLDSAGPPLRRRPILVVTERPGAVADAYLQLRLSRSALRPLAQRRRVVLYERHHRVPDSRETLWDVVIEAGEDDLRLHNLFPAGQLLRAGATARPVGPREHLGRGDDEGPAVLLVRPFDAAILREICSTHAPILVIVDDHGTERPPHIPVVPSIVFHDSLFAQGLTRTGTPERRLILLPDRALEAFALGSRIDVMEPDVGLDARRAWERLDGATQLLIERVDERPHQVLRDLLWLALRLRTILLQLPLHVEAYEQCLILSGLSESRWDGWSVRRLFQRLENRQAEVAAVGPWEAMLHEELLAAVGGIIALRGQGTPKAEAIRAVSATARPVALIATSRVIAAALDTARSLPAPFGLGLSGLPVRAICQDDLGTLAPGETCVVHHAFEPSRLLAGLVRAGPREATFILLPNELRFFAGRLAGVREALRTSAMLTRLFEPLYAHLDRISILAPSLQQSSSTPAISPLDLERFQRLFERGMSQRRLGTVLFASPAVSDATLRPTVDAVVVELSERRAVLLEPGTRITVVGAGDSVRRVLPEGLEPGDRLIVIDADAREAIVDPVLAARSEEEARDGLMVPVLRWQQELCAARERGGVTYEQLLEQLRARGSRLTDPAAIGAWVRRASLGPLDAHDVLRVGQVLGSAWITAHWEEVGVALLFLRTGHRLLGRQMTRLIERAAVGDTELSADDHAFLLRLGITMAVLQDAVDLLTVEVVGTDIHPARIEQIGHVVALDEGELYGSC